MCFAGCWFKHNFIRESLSRDNNRVVSGASNKQALIVMLGSDLRGICKNILMILFIRRVKAVLLLVVILEDVSGLIMHIA